MRDSTVWDKIYTLPSPHSYVMDNRAASENGPSPAPAVFRCCFSRSRFKLEIPPPHSSDNGYTKKYPSSHITPKRCLIQQECATPRFRSSIFFSLSERLTKPISFFGAKVCRSAAAAHGTSGLRFMAGVCHKTCHHFIKEQLQPALI